MRSNWGVLHIVGKIFPRAIRYSLQNRLDLKKYECPKLWDNKSPSFDRVPGKNDI
jgi:hypothetical protein